MHHHLVKMNLAGVVAVGLFVLGSTTAYAAKKPATDLACEACVELEELEFDPATQAEHDAHVADPDAHHADTLGGLGCADGEVAKSDGIGGWSCQTDAGTDLSDLQNQIDALVASVITLEIELFTKTVFVTSIHVPSNFVFGTGQPASDIADGICNDLAFNATPPLIGNFRAWLSTSALDDPNSRFVKSPLPYLRTDGLQVAADYAALTNTDTFDLEEPIIIDESGNVHAGGHFGVFTGTLSDGEWAGGLGDNDCNGWTTKATGNSGLVGFATHTAPSWTDGLLFACGQSGGDPINFHLYCFEQ